MLKELMDGLSSGEMSGDDIKRQISVIRYMRLQHDPSATVDYKLFSRLLRDLTAPGGMFEADGCGEAKDPPTPPPTEEEIRAHFDRFDVAKRGAISGAMATTAALPSFRDPDCASEEWLKQMVSVVSKHEGKAKAKAAALSSILTESEILELRAGVPKEVSLHVLMGQGKFPS